MPKRHHHAPHDDRKPPKRRHGDAKFNLILKRLTTIEKEIKSMAIKMSDIVAALTPLTDAVTAMETVVDKLVAKIQELVTSGASQAQMQEALDKINAERTRIANAALAGTAADPAAP